MLILVLVVFTNLCSSCGGKIPLFLRTEESDFATSLNKSVDPCIDFYQYSCGNWLAKNIKSDSYPFWNHWQRIHQKILDRMERILKTDKPTPPKYLQKAQNMFRACVHRKNSESKYINDLRVLIDHLYGWPMVYRFWNEINYNWSIHIAKVTQMIHINPIIKMHVFIDTQNTSQYILYIECGEMNLPHSILQYPKQYENYIALYKTWIYKVVQNLYPNCTNTMNIKQEIEEMVNFETQLAKLHEYKDKSEKISVKELINKFPLKWMDIFEQLFDGTSVKFTLKSQVFLRAQRYLNNLLLLLSITKTRTIANYITWSMVKVLSPETSEFMRRLSFLMDSEIYGIKQNIPLAQECVNKVNTYMDIALIPEYVKRYVHPNTFNEVTAMAENIKIQFIKMLKTNTWLGDVTKEKAIEKIDALKYIIAYPERFNNKTILENKYKKIKITNNHFTNILRLKISQNELKFAKLDQSITIEWPGSVFDVNAYYGLLQNFIFIPLGIMEPPFFNTMNPKALNYGALGSLIGHELSHSLDVTGRHVDKHGNLIDWWSKIDKIKYQDKTECFKQQYNNYKVDGANTLGENIADNVGLKLSYNAYKNLKLKEKSNLVLKQFSSEQLFFISFAQMWCESSNKNEFIDEEDHAPVMARVLGAVHNSWEFEGAFCCSKNDATKCQLW